MDILNVLLSSENHEYLHFLPLEISCQRKMLYGIRLEKEPYGTEGYPYSACTLLLQNLAVTFVDSNRFQYFQL